MSADKHFTPRHKARAIVLQCLYEIDVAGHPVDEVLEQNLARVRLTPELMDFVRSLVRSVREQVPRLDELIGRFAPAWPVAQLPFIDRNVLRLAIYEITNGDQTPPKVAVNEAVELAKSFGSESSPKFVNGVLGSVLATAAQ